MEGRRPEGQEQAEVPGGRDLGVQVAGGQAARAERARWYIQYKIAMLSIEQAKLDSSRMDGSAEAAQGLHGRQPQRLGDPSRPDAPGEADGGRRPDRRGARGV